MTEWIRWTVPAAALVSISAPAYAVQYMSVAEAQRAAFPSAHLTEAEAGRVWKTGSGGVFVLDHVIGKHLYIDYAVSIEGGRVRRVDILAYREILRRRSPQPKLAVAVRRQDQREPAESRQRHSQYIRGHPVLDARDGRREKDSGRVWTHPIAFVAPAFVAPARCLERSSKSAAPELPPVPWNRRSMRLSLRSPKCTV